MRFTSPPLRSTTSTKNRSHFVQIFCFPALKLHFSPLLFLASLSSSSLLAQWLCAAAGNRREPLDGGHGGPSEQSTREQATAAEASIAHFGSIRRLGLDFVRRNNLVSRLGAAAPRACPGLARAVGSGTEEGERRGCDHCGPAIQLREGAKASQWPAGRVARRRSRRRKRRKRKGRRRN